MQPIYLICGVSGSGKSWVCRQLTDKFFWLKHDEHFNNHIDAVEVVAKTSDKPIITECPFGERLAREALEKKGLKVVPIFVVEEPDLVKLRYESRENKPLPKNVYSHASSIRNRAQEWGAIHGKSDEILQVLQRMTL